MDRPQNLIIPTLHAGNIALISWDSVPESNTYQLDRQTNLDADFIGIFSGSNNSFQDFLPEDAITAAYRVQATNENDRTWDELEALNHTWDDLDALDWAWVFEYSDFTYSETKEVIPNRPPVISGQDADLGTRYRGFDVIFSATDPDPNNTISLQVKLNSTIIFTMPNAQQGADYTITVTDAQIFAMADLSVHNIIIMATDNKGATATRIFTFTAVEDLVSTAVFYVLRDGQPIANIVRERQWTDYLEVGTHRYRIRGVDRYGNFSDSNEVTVTIALKHATLGLVSNPSNFVGLIWRLDGKPTMGQNYDTSFSEEWYEGRTFPVYEYSGRKSNSMSLAFSTLNLQDQQAIFNIISQSLPVVYRDQYESRIVGVVPNFASELQGRYKTATHNALINFNMTLNRADFNEVIEYD